MDLVSAVLCDAATQREDSGYDLTNVSDLLFVPVDDFPVTYEGTLFARFLVHPREDGGTVHLSVSAGERDEEWRDLNVVLSGDYTIPRPARHVHPHHVWAMSFFMDLVLPDPGAFDIVLALDGVELTRQPLTVIATVD